MIDTELEELRTIWAVYDHLKHERDTMRSLISVIEDDAKEARAIGEDRHGWKQLLSDETLGMVRTSERFLTNTLAAIDRGQGLLTENET